MNFRLIPCILLIGSILSCDKSTNPRVSSSENADASVTVGRDTSINIAAGQVQPVLFQAAANTTYLIQTSGNTDTRLELRESTGKITLAMDQAPSEINGQITWTATGAGSVQIVVSGQTSATTGPTTLQVKATNWPDSYETDNTLSAAKELPTDSVEPAAFLHPWGRGLGEDSDCGREIHSSVRSVLRASGGHGNLQF